MNGADVLEELKLLVRSRYGLVVIDTPQEKRVETLVRHLADQLRLPLFVWTRTKGLFRVGEEQPLYGTRNPSGALAHIAAAEFPAIYDVQGLGPDLEHPLLAAQLKEVARSLAGGRGAAILTGLGVELPASVKPYAAALNLPPPRLEDYRDLLIQILRDLSRQMPIEVAMTKAETRRLLENLKGLTLMEAEKVLTKAIVVDGRLGAEDIRQVIDAKREIVERDGLLEYYPAEATLAEIADLQGLKSWLAKRRKIIEKPEEARRFGLTFPKGVLLVGIPGTGKSLCAKAVAMEWGLPLLKMDPATLYNKYIGETEKNFKRAMETAQRMAPVVLWIDEIEKAFASATGGEESGVSARVLGTFLSWLQDRQGDVFAVATANDVSKLPPELLRKGRFDEIFFVDLPTFEAREKLLEIHLGKRGKDPAEFDIPLLARATEGFSGADVEQVVVSSLYTCFSEEGALATEALLREVDATRPLSRTMPERIAEMRAWAKGRTVPAN